MSIEAQLVEMAKYLWMTVKEQIILQEAFGQLKYYLDFLSKNI